MGSVSTSTDRLKEALEEAQQHYIKSNPESKKSYEGACRHLPGGNTRTSLHTSPFPLSFAKGDSCYLTTSDGHQLVDFLGEYTAGIYGHNHPVIRSAIESTIDRGWNYGGMSGLESQLATIVCSRFPAMELVRFVNSGTEANMMALATAVAYTKKKTILVFVKGYHGSTISGRIPSNKPSINLPHDFIVGSYNDIAGTETLISSLPASSLAAILVEPMLGSGGGYAATKPFLSTLRRLATQHSALLIFDEVMTSRLTYHGYGATFLPDIRPDLMTLGKWVGGGMSFGCFGGRRDIMSMFDPRTGQLEHPGTFNNNVFSMAAGIAGCELLTEEKINALNALGDQMREEIDGFLRSTGIISTSQRIPETPITDAENDEPGRNSYPKMFIKGVGSIMCIHFSGPERSLMQSLFFHHMLEQGIYMAQRGFMALNIELAGEHVEKYMAALTEFCDRYGEFLISE